MLRIRFCSVMWQVDIISNVVYNKDHKRKNKKT